MGTISSAGGNSFIVTASHVYAEEGSYTITVTIGHESSTPQVVTDTATVSNPAVVAVGGFTFAAAEGSSVSGKVATFTDPGGPEATSDYSATISWGDGGTSSGTISVSSGTFTVTGSHTYGEEGTFTITATINHENAAAQTVTSTATVSDPAVVGTTIAVNATAGAPFFNKPIANFTDPGGAEPNPSDSAGTINTHYAIVSINWGDGSPLDTSSGTLSFSGSPGSKTDKFTVSGSHTYAASGTYTITVVINHEGVMTTLTQSATVSSLGLLFQGSQTRTSGFWNDGATGQELIRKFTKTAGGQTLGQWLSSTFPKLYGGVDGAANLSTSSNVGVANFYKSLFTQFNSNQLDAEVMALALYIFATTSSLGMGAGGTNPATAYGLPVDANGLGAYTFNTGFHGAAFGVPNFTVLDIFQIMLAANNSAVGGEPWDSNLSRRNDGQAVIGKIDGDF